MSLAQRITRKRIDRFQTSKPKATGDFSDVVRQIIEELIKPRMLLLEKTVRAETDKAIEDVRAYLPILKSITEREIRNHIATRSVEIVGAKGEDGYSPVKGKDYFDGKTPTKEELLAIILPLIPKPIKGDDGKTPTEKELRRLFEPFIKQLLDELAKTVSYKRSGGGTGNRQHEHSAISSATTTITTTYKIAGGGFDVDVYYNGAYVARGTDYTVGSNQKTISLLFTPADNSVADVVYTRT